MSNKIIEKEIDSLVNDLNSKKISGTDFKEKIMLIATNSEEYFRNKNPNNTILRSELKENKEPIVEIQNLCKKYKGKKHYTIENLTFNIYPGHFHAFIGANGAGKTTTIKSIISVYSQHKYSGNIKINHYDNFTPEAKRVLGYIPEEAKFPKKMKMKTYLINMALLSGLTKEAAIEKINKIIAELELEKLQNKCPDSFSSGQKKKVLLAQALIHDPQVLVMDEPAANLDPMARIELFDTLVNLQKKGVAIFLSSHILDEVDKYATYVTILDGGKIVHDGMLSKNDNLSDLYKSYVKKGSLDTVKD